MAICGNSVGDAGLRSGQGLPELRLSKPLQAKSDPAEARSAKADPFPRLEISISSRYIHAAAMRNFLRTLYRLMENSATRDAAGFASTDA